MTTETLHGMLERLRGLIESAECYADESKKAGYPPEQIAKHSQVAHDLKKCTAELQPLADQLQAVVERMECKFGCLETGEHCNCDRHQLQRILGTQK